VNAVLATWRINFFPLLMSEFFFGVVVGGGGGGWFFGVWFVFLIKGEPNVD